MRKLKLPKLPKKPKHPTHNEHEKPRVMVRINGKIVSNKVIE